MLHDIAVEIKAVDGRASKFESNHSRIHHAPFQPLIAATDFFVNSNIQQTDTDRVSFVTDLLDFHQHITHNV